MKVLFIYTDIGIDVGYSCGIGALSANLKRAGHEVKLIHVTEELDYPLDLERIRKDVLEYNPGLICFSAVTNQWYYVKYIARSLRQVTDIPICVGGHHANGGADQIIAEDAVDFVCKGEGEIPLLTLVEHLEKGLSAEGIANIWWKQNGQVIVNPVGMWVQELDDLPFEDREIFDFARIVDRRHGWAEVISTRGCPYECTYCFNRAFFDMYQIANTELRMKDYIRRRNVDSAIQMLLEVRERYPNVKYFTFVDDIFGLIGEWLINFCNQYHDRVGVTFACTSQPRSFNRRVAALLSHAGCKVLKMGVEAGNYYLRRHVLKRNISDECLIDAFDAAREYNLKPQAFNMIGLPTETKENIQETIRLNANLRPYIVWMSTFMPYPGTELWEFCRENDLIDDSKWDVVNSYRGDSVLRENYISNIDLRKMRTMFKWYLNADIGNEVSDTYRQNIKELDALPEDYWHDETARQIFVERDEEMDERFRRLKYDHYVTKKYVNIFWGKLYNYDLT